MMHVSSMSLSIHPSFSDGVLIKIIEYPYPSSPLLRNYLWSTSESLDVLFSLESFSMPTSIVFDIFHVKLMGACPLQLYSL